MTGPEFREQHGDPAGWMPADFDSFEVIVLTDTAPDFTLVMRQGTAPFPIPTTA